MNARCTLILSYKDEKEAEKLLNAVNVDDGGYMDSTQFGSQIRSIAEAATLDSLLHTLNDYLSCLSAAEKLVKD